MRDRTFSQSISVRDSCSNQLAKNEYFKTEENSGVSYSAARRYDFRNAPAVAPSVTNFVTDARHFRFLVATIVRSYRAGRESHP
jgi:hypothetical protein